MRCEAQLPLALDVTYYVSRKGLRWYLHPTCVPSAWVPHEGGWTFPTNQITVEEERVVWGCGCWRDMRGRRHARAEGCHLVHRAVSVWPPNVPM